MTTPVVVAALFICFISGPGSFVCRTSATSGPLLEKPMKGLCQASAGFKKTAKWISHRSNEISESIERLRNGVATFQVALEKGKLNTAQKSCANPNEVLEEGRKALSQSTKLLSTLQERGYLYALSAGLSAGRLEEFLMVFATAGSGGSDFCAAQSDGNSLLTQAQLTDCLTSTIGEANLINPDTLGELKWEQPFEFETEIGKLVSPGSPITNTEVIGNTGKNCKLASGASSNGPLASGGMQHSLLWGGGVLSVGKSTTGIQADGEVRDGKSNEHSKTTWQAKPQEKVEHLRRALAASRDFKNADQNLDKLLKKANREIQECLEEANLEETEGNETGFVKYHQSMFKELRKLNASLDEAQKTLDRYRKEKGELKPLPPSGGEGGLPPVSAPTASASRGTLLTIFGYLAALM